MHKRIPPELHSRHPQQITPPLAGLHAFPPSRKRHAGFSLVEVAMSIAIIGFAFVALIGMLPSGMRIFRGAMDTANENWILQDLNATIQTTTWSKIDSLAGDKGGDVYVYDDEGKLVDRVAQGAVLSATPEQQQRWQYVVKLVIEAAKRPGVAGAGASELPADSRLVTVVIAQVNKAKAMEELLKITKAGDLSGSAFKSNSGLRARSFIITRMDSAFD